jgi:hypothetical protein
MLGYGKQQLPFNWSLAYNSIKRKLSAIAGSIKNCAIEAQPREVGVSGEINSPFPIVPV